jgi:hypothetical protein
MVTGRSDACNSQVCLMQSDKENNDLYALQVTVAEYINNEILQGIN